MLSFSIRKSLVACAHVAGEVVRLQPCYHLGNNYGEFKTKRCVWCINEECMDERIPASLHPLLEQYVALLQRTLPDLVDACYLHGSLALSAFNLHFSDIDFITVLKRRASAAEVERLQSLHQTIAARYPHWPLEGSYLQWEDLGQLEDAVTLAPCVHDGILRPAGHHDINLVTWWVLQQHGIAVFGPLPQTLKFTVDWKLLQTQMYDNLNSYWVGFTRSPAKIAYLSTSNGVQWAVLGVLRQFYTFQEHDIISKTAAGHYALKHLPARWHRLIHEAINVREQQSGSFYKSRALRTIEAVQFMHYIIKRCNAQIYQPVGSGS